MRLLPLALLSASLLLAPSAPVAGAGADEPEAGEPAAGAADGAAGRPGRARSCRVLRKQIAHFEDVAELADDRGNELWEQATLQHIERLEARQRRTCPQDVPPGLSAQLGELARLIGNAAKTAFTLGLL